MTLLSCWTGSPIFNIDSLIALDPLRIRKLQTVNRRIFMGGVNFPGIMNWTTYKGDLGGYILDPRATVIDYEGLQMRREFYEPVSYATEIRACEPSARLPQCTVLGTGSAGDCAGKGRAQLLFSPTSPANTS